MTTKEILETFKQYGLHESYNTDPLVHLIINQLAAGENYYSIIAELLKLHMRTNDVLIKALEKVKPFHVLDVDKKTYEAMIYSISEASEYWQKEYDNARQIIGELVKSDLHKMEGIKQIAENFLKQYIHE